LKTVASLTLGCVLSLALCACGGGQLAGKQAGVAPVTTATQRPASTPAQAPRTTATTPQRPATTQAATRPATTSTQPPATTPTRTTPPSSPTTPAKATTRAASTVAAHPIQETADVRLVKAIAPAHYLQAGRVTGTFDGQMQVEVKAVDAGISVTFTVQVDGGGTVAGHGLVTPNLTAGGGLPPIKGFADITSGTGRLAHARGRHLAVTGRAALDGSRGTVRLTGVVTY
jgi:hypothetical protein